MDRFLVYVQILIKNEHIQKMCSVNGQIIIICPNINKN